jgi:hypothetical protein
MPWWSGSPFDLRRLSRVDADLSPRFLDQLKPEISLIVDNSADLRRSGRCSKRTSSRSGGAGPFSPSASRLMPSGRATPCEELRALAVASTSQWITGDAFPSRDAFLFAFGRVGLLKDIAADSRLAGE